MPIRVELACDELRAGRSVAGRKRRGDGGAGTRSAALTASRSWGETSIVFVGSIERGATLASSASGETRAPTTSSAGRLTLGRGGGGIGLRDGGCDSTGGWTDMGGGKGDREPGAGAAAE